MADAASVRDIDSIPKDVVQRCEPEKQDWIAPDRRGSLREPTSPLTEAAAETTAAPANSIKPKPALVRGANHDDQHWSKLLPQLTDKERHESIAKLQAHFCRVLLLSQQSPLAKLLSQENESTQEESGFPLVCAGSLCAREILRLAVARSVAAARVACYRVKQ